ncbi:MAG: hypothetical protein ACXVC0_05850 [Bdellovibrionota bacterium]
MFLRALVGSLVSQAAGAPRFVSTHVEVRGWNAYYYCSAESGERDVRRGEALYEVKKAAHAVCANAVVEESSLQIAGNCHDQITPTVYVLLSSASYRCGD